MAISPQPTKPNRLTQTQAEFSINASNIVDWQGEFADELNSVSSTYYLSVSTTSSTSNTIGTGSKSFTVQTGLGFVLGNAVRIANSGTNYMTGDVTSYNSGTGALVVNVTSSTGSGTHTSWTISLAAVGASAASDISNTPAGNISATTVQAAINELDTEKLSSAAGAVTGTNLEDIITASSVGTLANIPVITYDANGRITATSTAAKITIGTPVAVTTGTSVSLSTTIPSTVKKITVLVSGISTSGTSAMGIQIGTSSGLETTGYATYAVTDGGSPTRAIPTNILPFMGAMVAANTHSGVGFLIKGDGNTWHWTANMGSTNSASQGGFGLGNKTLSDVLTRLTIIMANGTDTFDGGSGSVTLILE